MSMVKNAGGPEAVGAHSHLASKVAAVLTAWLLREAAHIWNLATSSGPHHRVALDAVRLNVGALRCSYVAGLVAALRDVGYDLNS